MKPSEKKKKLVEELAKLFETLDVVQLYHLPRQDVTQNWLADTAAVLKNLDEGDYQEFVKLSRVITPTETNRETRKKAAYEIKAFVTRKVAEYRRYDFSSLDKREVTSEAQSKLMFGQPSKMGQAGGGGSIYINAKHFNLGETGRISADGGDYISQKNTTNSQIQTGDINISKSDIANAFNRIKEQLSKNMSLSNNVKAKELLDSLEKELKNNNKKPDRITKIFGQIKSISKWLAGQLIQGAVGGLIKAYIPPVMVTYLS